MEQVFEKYSLLLLVTIYVQSAITNKRNSFKWWLHQSAAAMPQSSSEGNESNRIFCWTSLSTYHSFCSLKWGPVRWQIDSCYWIILGLNLLNYFFFKISYSHSGCHQKKWNKTNKTRPNGNHWTIEDFMI